MTTKFRRTSSGSSHTSRLHESPAATPGSFVRTPGRRLYTQHMPDRSTPILLATNNPHKLEELSEIFSGSCVTLLTIRDVPDAAVLKEPDETGMTFEANAELKATYYARATNMHCLADDSGLEADAIDGGPGVYSARYAGVGASRDERDAANNAKLLDSLSDVPDELRTARFVCAMCLAGPDGTPITTVRGTFEGRIAPGPKGRNGFGYDPIFVITNPSDPLRGTHAAELTAEQKHARSHRGKAARLIAPHIHAHVGGDV